MESCLSLRMKLPLLIVLAMSCFGCVSRQAALLDDGAIVEAFLGGYRSVVSSPRPPVVAVHHSPRRTMVQLEAEELLTKFVRKFLTFEICPFNEAEVEQQMLKFEPFLESTKNSKTHLIELFRQMI